MPLDLHATLPQSFHFFDLGEVSLESERPTNLNLAHQQGIGFQFLGSSARSMLLLVDESFDLSMATEMGNIIASKLAGRLSQVEGWDVGISPPQVWPEAKVAGALGNLFKSDRIHLSKYVFSFKGNLIPIQIAVFLGDEIHV